MSSDDLEYGKRRSPRETTDSRVPIFELKSPKHITKPLRRKYIISAFPTLGDDPCCLLLWLILLGTCKQQQYTTRHPVRFNSIHIMSNSSLTRTTLTSAIPFFTNNPTPPSPVQLF